MSEEYKYGENVNPLYFRYKVDGVHDIVACLIYLLKRVLNAETFYRLHKFPVNNGPIIIFGAGRYKS